MNLAQFEAWCREELAAGPKPLVPFDAENDVLYPFDFTAMNPDLPLADLSDTAAFSQWVSAVLEKNGARYGVGGYFENRVLYQRSAVFGDSDPAKMRSLHLGLDIWGPAGTPVFAPFPGQVHSVGMNHAFGDYGATLVLVHASPHGPWYTLYGHLATASVQSWVPGQFFAAGEKIAALGEPAENGDWPPHLHFQIILDMEGKQGDYPGVCAPVEANRYQLNCPDPALLGVVPRL